MDRSGSPLRSADDAGSWSDNRQGGPLGDRRMTRLSRAIGLTGAALLLACVDSFAQTAPAEAPQLEKPATDAPPPPYEPQLLRLSEIMGALAYLRDLCGAPDADAFRAKMAALLEVEAKTDARKERLAGAYNRGFEGYALTYRACTPAAHEIVARFLDEAARISKDLANRYGG
jgi:uncharacterized protein (TIGR02301 family)